MKKLTLLIAFVVFATYCVNAQESGRIREIGVYTSDLSNFGLRYKWGTEKTRFRITAANFSLSTSDGSTDFGMGTSFGIEKPKPLSEKVELYYGGQVSASFYSGDVDSYSTGVGFILGASCKLSESIYISCECVPALTFSSVNDVETVGLNISNYAGITLGFRF
jgi:hypothetical protein